MNVIDNDTFIRIQNRKISLPTDETIIFKKCNDNPPFHGSFVPKFQCKKVIFYKCSKDFVYMWLNKLTMPQVEIIYFRGELESYSILHRFPNAIWNISKDSTGFPDIQRISDDKFDEFVNEKNIFSLITKIFIS